MPCTVWRIGGRSRKTASGFRLQASGFGLQASGFRLQASGFRLQASGFRKANPETKLNHVRIQTICSADSGKVYAGHEVSA
jgi:hypothetical protein